MREQRRGAKPYFGQRLIGKIWHSVKQNFVFATLNFLFITVFITAFTSLFGAQNSILAVIMSILMGVCANKDVSRAPLRHFLVQTTVFAGMTTAACFAVSLGPWLAVPIHLVTIFFLLYAYTYEYSGHLYFPYILSYLFLVFISPVPPSQLPLRLAAVVVGCACMVLYALVLCRRNVLRPARIAVRAVVAQAGSCAAALADGETPPDCIESARAQIRTLSGLIKNRRKGLFNIPDSAVALYNVAWNAESLIDLIGESAQTEALGAIPWQTVAETLRACEIALDHRSATLPKVPDATDFGTETATLFYEHLRSICASLARFRTKRSASAQDIAVLAEDGTDEEGRIPAKPSAKARSRTALSARIKAGIGYSPVRLIYAIRVTLLLTLFLMPVQYFRLPHGKWLLFTLASVSMPYAEDVAPKAGKRLLATLVGGTASLILFALIPDPAARTAVMMASGYLSFYFPGYVGNYACATVGALGGAVGAVQGWSAIAATCGIRLGYIAVGIGIALIANVAICPFRRKRASESLFCKYDLTSRILTEPSAELLRDPRLYYHVAIEHNLLEDKLLRNASSAHTDISALTDERRNRIRNAQRARFREKTG